MASYCHVGHDGVSTSSTTPPAVATSGSTATAFSRESVVSDKTEENASFTASPTIQPNPLVKADMTSSAPTELVPPSTATEGSTDDVIVGDLSDTTTVLETDDIIDDTEIATAEVEDDEQACDPEVEQAPENMQESGGILTTLVKGGTKVVQSGMNVLQSGKKVLKSIGTKAAKTFGYVEYQVVHEKTTSIALPFGSVPKTHCRSITYTPALSKRGQKPVISLTITPIGSCHHEDTHLFVRFCHS